MFRAKSAKVERIKSAKKKKTKKVSIVGEDKIEEQNTKFFPESRNVTKKTKIEDDVKKTADKIKIESDDGISDKILLKKSETHFKGPTEEGNNKSNQSEENESEEPLNIDALILNYKSTESKEEIDFLVDRLEKESIKSGISEKEEVEDSKDDLEIEDINLKSTRFSKLFKKDKEAVDRSRQNLIKKKDEDVTEKAGQLLREVCMVLIINHINQIIGQTMGKGKTSDIKWGSVQFSTRKVSLRPSHQNDQFFTKSDGMKKIMFILCNFIEFT